MRGHIENCWGPGAQLLWVGPKKGGTGPQASDVWKSQGPTNEPRAVTGQYFGGDTSETTDAWHVILI